MLSDKSGCVLNIISSVKGSLVISDIVKEEIENSKNNDLINSFYNYLKEVEFYHISNGNISKLDVSSFRNREIIPIHGQKIVDTALKLSHEICGTKEKIGFKEICNQLQEALAEFADDSIMSNLAQSSIDILSKSLESVPAMNDPSFDGINEVFKHLNVNEKQLGCIQPPNVIKQIWEAIEPDLNKENQHSFEDVLFGEMHGKKSFNEKIIALNLALHLLAYGRDKKARKFSTFLGTQNDGRHLTEAISCNILMTIDANFAQRAAAIFEYFDITSIVAKLIRIDDKMRIDIVFPYDSNKSRKN